MSENFSKTAQLIHFMFKRERINSTLWIIGLVALTVLVAIAFENMYSTPEELLGMAETMKNPAMIAMVGPVFGETYTLGAMMSQMMLLFTGIAVATMSIFIVIKHTRADEESGRFELIRSRPVGKLADIKATMSVVFIVNLIMAVLIAIGLAILNIDSMDLTGSIVYGASIGVIGIFFASIAALAAQISSTRSGAYTISFIALAVMYIMRAIGDAGSNFLAYISPLGLFMHGAPYVYNVWWPLIIIFVISILINLVVFILKSKRDLGEGLIAAKKGRSDAKNSLLSPMGLSLKLLRGMLIGWFITMFVFGASYGSIFGDLESFLEGNEMMQQIFLSNTDFTFAEQFLTTLLVMYSMFITVPVLLILNKIRTEEKKGRIEHLYTKPIARRKVFANYILITLVSSIIMMTLFVVGLWAAAYTVMAEPLLLTTALAAGLVYLPAIWVMMGLAAFLIGNAPKRFNLIWYYAAGAFVVLYIGRMLNFPEWLDKLFPFAYVPQVPVEHFEIMPLIILTALANILFMAAMRGYEKRDITN